MKALLKPAAVALALLAGALVFAPLVAALTGTGLGSSALGAAFRGLAGLLGRLVGGALVSALVALVLGVPFALLIDRARRGLRAVLWAVGLMVLMVPPYIVAQSWIVLLGPAGKVSRPLALILVMGPRGNDPVELARFAVPGFVYTWPVFGVVMGGCLFPIVALAVAAAMRRTDRRIFESARIARGFRGVWETGARVLLSPALGAALLVFAVTLTEFAVPQLLRVRTVGEAVYEQIQEGDVGAAAALCLPLLPLVVAAGALGAVMLLRSRTASLAGLEGEIPRFEGRRTGWGADVGAGVMTFIAAIPAFVLPFIALAWLALTAARPHASELGTHKLLRASGFLESLHGAWELAHDDAVRTVWLACLAATAATALAVALVRLAPRVRGSWVPGALAAGLAVPAPIVALGLITLWNHSGGGGQWVYQSPVIVVLAWFARFFPIVAVLAQGALARVPRELESAAALAGRRPLERLTAVVLPIAAPGLVAAWLAMYVLAATEFSATLLVAPPGLPMLAPSVVNLMRRGQDPEIAACQVLLLAVVALPLVVIALAWAARRWPRPAVRGAA